MIFLISLIVSFLWGMAVNWYGNQHTWSETRKVIIAGLGSFVLTLGFISLSAQASEVAKDKLRKATIHIAIGTGSMVEAPSHKVYILTNWHVCNSIKWKGFLYGFFSDGTMVRGEVKKTDPNSDLCAALVPEFHDPLKPAKSLKLHQTIYTRGYPEGILAESQGKYQGKVDWDYELSIEDVGVCFKGSYKVEAFNGNIRGCKVTYTSNLSDLYARPGSSGSPVVNANGELVGVISSWQPSEDFEAGMVPYEQVIKFLKGL